MTTTVARIDRLIQENVHWIDVDGIRTRVYEEGSGEPLVLIHGGQYGGLVSAIDAWSINFPELASRFHIYAFDKLGMGQTDNPKQDADYSFEALFNHTIGVLDALGIGDAYVVGHSRGGFLATRIAFEQPKRVRRLIIVDSNTSSPDPSMSAAFGAELKSRIQADAGLGTHIEMTLDAYSHSMELMTPNFQSRLLESAEMPKSAEARDRMQSVAQTVWMPSLNRARTATFETMEESGLPVPALIVWGYNEKSAPLSQGMQLLDLAAKKSLQLEMHILNRAGHFSFREQPEAFNRVLFGFCLD